MGALLGKNAKCYYGTVRATWGALGTDLYTHEATASNVAALSLTELTDIKDLSFSIESGQADVSTRVSDWEATLATLKKASIDFDMVYDPSDSGFLKIQSCFFLNTNLPLAVLDGSKATVGTRGFWLDAQVTKFEKKEGLADAQMVSVSLQPGYSTVAPEPVKVT